VKIVGYKTVNLINGHFYYGVRTLRNSTDSYLGSGLRLKEAIKKHGRENFIREDLIEFETFQEALKWEQDILTDDLIKSKECYNLKPGGAGGSLPWTEEQKVEHKEHGNYKKTSQTRKKLSEAAKRRFSEAPGTFKNREHTEETKQLLSEQRKGRPGKNKGKKLNLTEKRKSELRAPKSSEVRAKISKALCKLTEEQINFLKKDFKDIRGARTKLAREWNVNLDQIARIIGRRYKHEN